MEANKIPIRDPRVHPILKMINSVDTIDLDFIRKMGWRVCIADDNQIFAEDAYALEAAWRYLGVSEFYFHVLGRDELGHENLHGPIRADSEHIESLQYHQESKMIYENVIITSLPISFAILRTGDVRHSVYAGPPIFINLACIGSNPDAEIQKIGRGVEPSILKYYGLKGD